MIARILAGAALAAMAIQTAHADDREAAFRATYKELVETNTTLSSGSCTLAAQRMGAHLAAAGFAPGQITYFATPEHPKEGGLVAVLPGTSPTARPILLLAHIDVVEAKRADWTRLRWSRKAAISGRAAHSMTRRWPRSGSIPWPGSRPATSNCAARSNSR
jgi:acetylornithine deacetylase/succinyl-diaminopimelate desuccinylase-like protein